MLTSCEISRFFQKEIWEAMDQDKNGFKLRISNYHKNGKITKDELTEFVDFVLDRLITDRLKESLTINCFLLDKHEQGFVGECTPTESGIQYPKEFDINLLVKQPKPKILKTLAHELVHVKQYARGELYDHIKSGIVTYQKVRYNTDDINYWEYPWEIEAFGRAIGLYYQYIETKTAKKYQ